MVTVYGEVVETQTRTAQEWVEGWELDSGGCCVKWNGNWYTIAGTSRDEWLVYFKVTKDIGFAYPLPHLLEIGFRARAVECPKCASRDNRCWDSQYIYDEEHGHQVGERGFFVCNVCKETWTEE